MICFGAHRYFDSIGTSKESSANPAWSKTELPPIAKAPCTLPSWSSKARNGLVYGIGCHHRSDELQKSGTWFHANKEYKVGKCRAGLHAMAGRKTGEREGETLKR